MSQKEGRQNDCLAAVIMVEKSVFNYASMLHVAGVEFPPMSSLWCKNVTCEAPSHK